MDDAPLVGIERHSKRKARIPHMCAICSEPILVGETYIYYFAVVDGVVETQKRHMKPACALMLSPEDLKDAE
jgi:hypothetical protein